MNSRNVDGWSLFEAPVTTGGSPVPEEAAGRLGLDVVLILEAEDGRLVDPTGELMPGTVLLPEPEDGRLVDPAAEVDED